MALANGGAITFDGDELNKNDVSIPNAEEFNRVSQDRAHIEGFTTTVDTRTKSNRHDTVTLYSNAEADKSQPFNAYYGTVDTVEGAGSAEDGIDTWHASDTDRPMDAQPSIIP